eukprot:1441021-Prymnesium_polylepis.1
MKDICDLAANVRLNLMLPNDAGAVREKKNEGPSSRNAVCPARHLRWTAMMARSVTSIVSSRSSSPAVAPRAKRILRSGPRFLPVSLVSAISASGTADSTCLGLPRLMATRELASLRGEMAPMGGGAATLCLWCAIIMRVCPKPDARCF